MTGWRSRGREETKENEMRKVSSRERRWEINNNRERGKHDEVRNG